MKVQDITFCLHALLPLLKHSWVVNDSLLLRCLQVCMYRVYENMHLYMTFVSVILHPLS